MRKGLRDCASLAAVLQILKNSAYEKTFAIALGFFNGHELFLSNVIKCAAFKGALGNDIAGTGILT